MSSLPSLRSPTVWVLGAGFSRCLGGPLLTELFAKQSRRELQALYPANVFPSLATQLLLAKALFHDGLGRTWSNAEEFLARVEASCLGGDGDDGNLYTNLRAQIDDVANRDGDLLSLLTSDRSWVSGEQLPRAMRRAMAAECSRFLFWKTNETWEPYRMWVEALMRLPTEHTVISFNYDTAVETVCRQLMTSACSRCRPMLPNEETGPPDTVETPFEFLKLHGSVEWKKSGEKVIPVHSPERNAAALSLLKDPTAEIAIATPGAGKESTVRQCFQPLWEKAVDRLCEARSVVFLGYGFPTTDAKARLLFLSNIGLNRRNGPAEPVDVHLVLGPHTDTRRIERLLGSMNYRLDRLKDPRQRISVIRHPLGAEDFIADFQSIVRSQGEASQ